MVHYLLETASYKQAEIALLTSRLSRTLDLGRRPEEQTTRFRDPHEIMGVRLAGWLERAQCRQLVFRGDFLANDPSLLLTAYQISRRYHTSLWRH